MFEIIAIYGQFKSFRKLLKNYSSSHTLKGSFFLNFFKFELRLATQVSVV